MSQTPFEQVLGPAFEHLPAPVRLLHGLRQPLRTAGRAEVTAATGVLTRLLCWFAGLPKPGQMDVSVMFVPRGSREFWDRRFGDRRYASTIRAGTGKDEGCIVEHFRPFQLRFELMQAPGELIWVVNGWRLLGIPLPRWSVPTIRCVEAADGERFTFDIDVTFPVIGWVIRYRGWLLPQPSRVQPAG